MITVVSTGFKHPQKRVCLASVASQQGVEREHIYIDAYDQVSPKGCLENFHDVVMGLPPDRIVAWLDGDDRLFDSCSLRVVADVYDRKPETLVTYGQYCTFDAFGRYFAGRCSAYETDEPRKEPWRASHLKTFRAGMFHRIAKADMMQGGRFLEYTIDLAVMFPILEMAGRDRSVFNPVVVYVYDTWHAESMGRDKEIMREADAIGERLRALPKYERIASL
jgi:hypothetical protein